MVNSTQHHIPEGSDKRTFLDRIGSPGEIRVALLLSVIPILAAGFYHTKVNKILDPVAHSSSFAPLPPTIGMDDVLKVTAVTALSTLSDGWGIDITIPANVLDEIAINSAEATRRNKDLRETGSVIH